MQLIRRICVPAAAAFLCCLLGGCGKPPVDDTSTVEGKVSLDGKPLKGGTINFRAAVPGGRVEQVSGAINTDGTFVVAGVPHGKVLVSLDTETLKALQESKISLGEKAYTPLPQKFRNFETSGLDFEVQPGTQKKEFDLK